MHIIVGATFCAAKRASTVADLRVLCKIAQRNFCIQFFTNPPFKDAQPQSGILPFLTTQTYAAKYSNAAKQATGHVFAAPVYSALRLFLALARFTTFIRVNSSRSCSSKTLEIKRMIPSYRGMTIFCSILARLCVFLIAVAKR